MQPSEDDGILHENSAREGPLPAPRYRSGQKRIIDLLWHACESRMDGKTPEGRRTIPHHPPEGP